MSAAVSLPEEPDELLVAHTCFAVAHREVRRCMGVVAVLQREADRVLDRLAPAHAELEMWTDVAEQTAREIARRAT